MTSRNSSLMKDPIPTFKEVVHGKAKPFDEKDRG
jgi:hypothetical protein